MSNKPLSINLVPNPQFTLKVVNKSGLEKSTFTFLVGNNSSSLFQSQNNTGSQFDPVPERVDDTDPIYFYFGWSFTTGGWLIQRQNRMDSQGVIALVTTNLSYSTLDEAWIDREILTYN